MSKISVLFLAVILFVSMSCSGPSGYVAKAVRIMDKHGLFAEGDNWQQAKEKALAAKPEDINQAQDIIREALKVSGGKHSFIYLSEDVKEDASSEWTMPSVEILDDKIAVIKIPGFMGNKDEGIRYANTVIESVPKDVKGAMIDLRGNNGGNMYPMIASVHRFVSQEGKTIGFKTRKGTQWIPLPYIVRIAGVEKKGHIDVKVAILTDENTASSAEATLICFRGQDGVKVFGSPTAGYASANVMYPLPDGSRLVLTTSCDVAQTMEEFCDDPLVPDVPTQAPYEDALEWLRQ